jgi:predicted nucleic acid-binding protein
MTKTFIFDTGPIITFALNNLIWLIPELKEACGGRFCIPAAVKKELIDKPLTTRRYKLEALQLIPLLNDGVIEVIDKVKTDAITRQLLEELNTIYYAKEHPIKIVHEGEVDAISCALLMGADALVVDERNTRYLIETPKRLQRRLEKKLHTKVIIDEDMLAKVQQKFKGLKVLRTAELATVAYELGLLDRYINKGLVNAKRKLLEGLLWGVKLNGCAMTPDEIDEIMKIEQNI